MTDAPEAHREIHHAQHMSDTEALMWTAEQDPWLSSAMGSVFVLDHVPEFDRLLDQMNEATHSVLRLRERVVPGIGLAPPRWVLDEEFDIRDHVRHVRLPSPGGHRQLLDLAAQVFGDPFDRNRPLWQFIAVEGCGEDIPDAVQGALILKLHHSVSDGIGAVRLAEMYMDIERDPPPKEHTPDPVPLAPMGTASGLIDGAKSDLSHLAKRPLDAIRQAAAEMAMWGADPSRMRDTAGDAVSIVRSVADSLTGGEVDEGSGSSLWRDRSRRRHLETFDLRLDDVKTAAKIRGVSINDIFVAGSVIAADRYHAERGAEVSAFNLSFIVSTREDEAAGGNAWAPLMFSVPAGSRSVEDHLLETQAAMAVKREEAEGGSADVMEVVGVLAYLVPASVVTKAGRARTAKQDWATSNLRAAPFPLFVAGSEITHMYPVGPLAGTAFNLTAMSYNGSFHFGLHVDPRAVEDPANLRDHLIGAYSDLVGKGE